MLEALNFEKAEHRNSLFRAGQIWAIPYLFVLFACGIAAYSTYTPKDRGIHFPSTSLSTLRPLRLKTICLVSSIYHTARSSSA